MCVGQLKQKNLHDIQPSWLSPYTVTLQELDLSENKLIELPECLPWDFQNLQKLDVSKNKLTVFKGPTDTQGYQDLCPRLVYIEGQVSV